ncbi:MAG: efflux RND transporter periplasmic adaptor subunit [Bacteroidota bacterium]
MRNIQIRPLFAVVGLFIAITMGIGLGYLLFNSPNPRHNDHEESHVHLSDAHEVWTCSMHPQIRQNTSGDCPICGMDLIPLEENTSTDPLVMKMTLEAVKLAQIETYIVGNTNVSSPRKALTLSGKIQADERLSANQVTHIPGRIEKLYISFEGETVRKGQKIARLYAPEFVTAQKELLEAAKLKSLNPRLLEAARRKLINWKIPQSQIDQIEKAGTIQETFDLQADVAGVVSKRLASEGDHLEQGASLFEVINLQKVWVVFDAYEEDVRFIQLGDQVQFSVSALPNQDYMTTVNFIDPVIHPQTRVASVRGDFANPNGKLKPEMFIQGQIQASTGSTTTETQLLVPKSAILWTGKRSVVYVKVQDAAIPSYRYTEVLLGERKGEFYVIESGLNAGDEVVSQGSFAIDAAAQLNNQRSMMNQWVSVKDQPIESPEKLAVSADFQQQLEGLVEEYLALKNTFVGSNPTSAQKAANSFLSRLTEFSQVSPGREAESFWEKSRMFLEKNAQAIAETEELAQQRVAFEGLSNRLIEVVQTLPTSDTLYIQHCPMAFEFKGADWLSREESIRNPYFGEEMLTCGSVTGEVK